MAELVVGIFVGGRSQRMGGRAKGNLLAPDGSGTLVQRLRDVTRAASPGARILLVGRADAYAGADLPALADDPPGIGPLGGLRALLLEAQRARASAIALSCDLPRLSRSVLRALIAAPPAAAVAPRPDGIWQPLIARYDPARALPALERVLATPRRSLTGVFMELGADARALSGDWDERELSDWDTPGDIDA